MKCFAPNPATYRGQPVEIAEDGSCELSTEALNELRAHGFREWTPDDEINNDQGSTTDPANLSRKELLSLLKGKNAGNITLMDTETLRGLAVKHLAGESIAVVKPQVEGEGDTVQGEPITAGGMAGELANALEGAEGGAEGAAEGTEGQAAAPAEGAEGAPPVEGEAGDDADQAEQ